MFSRQEFMVIEGAAELILNGQTLITDGLDGDLLAEAHRLAAHLCSLKVQAMMSKLLSRKHRPCDDRNLPMPRVGWKRFR